MRVVSSELKASTTHNSELLTPNFSLLPPFRYSPPLFSPKNPYI